MGVVTAARLRRFMSNPAWSTEQTQTAEDLCDQLESSLGDALGGALITPVPVVEYAPVLVATGQIDIAHPMATALSIDGVTVADGDPLPDGYTLVAGRLFYRVAGATFAEPFVQISSLTSWDAAWSTPNGSYSYTGWLSGSSGVAAPQPYSRTVRVAYQAGWGAHPTLVNAILRKASAFMTGRHADVVIAQGLDSNRPPPPPSEEWTPSELANLGRFRRLGVGRS